MRDVCFRASEVDQLVNRLMDELETLQANMDAASAHYALPVNEPLVLELTTLRQRRRDAEDEHDMVVGQGQNFVNLVQSFEQHLSQHMTDITAEIRRVLSEGPTDPNADVLSTLDELTQDRQAIMDASQSTEELAGVGREYIRDAQTAIADYIRICLKTIDTLNKLKTLSRQPPRRAGRHPHKPRGRG